MIQIFPGVIPRGKDDPFQQITNRNSHLANLKNKADEVGLLGNVSLEQIFKESKNKQCTGLPVTFGQTCRSLQSVCLCAAAGRNNESSGCE